MKKIIPALFVFTLFISGCIPPTQTNSNDNTNENTNTNGKNELITITEPTQNQTISGNYTAKGQAKGSWYFEATFPVSVTDESGKTLAQGYATAQGDWMTENFVPFTAQITIPSSATGKGYIVFYKANASGLPEQDDSVSVPVIFGAAQTQQVSVFFTNSQQSKDSTDCSLVYEVKRTIPKTTAIGTAAINELLKGPTAAEKTQGYETSLNSGVKLNKLTIQNGVARADFSKELDENIGGSCRVTSIRSQITKTLQQFPTVKEVVISRDGEIDETLQP